MTAKASLLVALPMLIGLSPIAIAQTEIALPTEKGRLTLIFRGLDPDGSSGAVLKASLRNDTEFQFDSVMFALYGFDAVGNRLRLCGSMLNEQLFGDGGCRFEVFDPIESGQTIEVRSPGNYVSINASQKLARAEWKILQAPYFIKYDIQSEPISNERFAITPTFGLNGIEVELQNKGSGVIEVAWDQSVYIDESGSSSRLIRSNVSFSEKDRPQPNTVVPPGSKVQEAVFPVDRIRQRDGRWTQLSILPDKAYIFDNGRFNDLQSRVAWVNDVYLPDSRQLAGKEVRLFLRLLVNDQKENVTMTFKIVKMVQ